MTNNQTYDLISGGEDADMFILCDHAGNAFPPGYGTLGLEETALSRHIAYDIGAAGVTQSLAKRLKAPAILSKYSRLLIDLNRAEDDPTLVMRISDGQVVPGNADIDDKEIDHRITAFHKPYHDAVDAQIDTMLARSITPALISIHSFTDDWRGNLRPWHVTILWDNDPRLAKPLIKSLCQEKGLVVGENVPYTGELKGDCMYRHGTTRGLPHVLIEIRQDLIATNEGQEEWAERIANHITSIRTDQVVNASLRSVHHFGSKNDTVSNGLSTIAQPNHSKIAIANLGNHKTMDDKTRTELEAAAFRRLVQHLRQRTDVQNIDLMNMAGFCRNCLSNWYGEAAAEMGLDLNKEAAREIIYGMPYSQWKDQFQKEASDEQRQAFEEAQRQNGH